MNNSFITFGSPLITKKEINEVSSVMKSGWLGTGPKVHQFEKNFSNYKKIKYASALNSCTAALSLSLLSLGIGDGDEVITTALTFCATINSIINSRAKPILVDVEYNSQNIDPEKIEQKITSKTKAIIIVHFAGRPCNMDKILKLVKKYKLFLIEDCAHAIESKYKNIHCGSFGDFGCFSFYITKNLTTGEGGMIVSNSKKNISKIKTLSLHGMTKDAWKRYGKKGIINYDVIQSGYKYNMMDMQAAMGIYQLKNIEKNYRKRERIWNFYNESFKNLNLDTPFPAEKNTRHAYHLYTLQINKNRCGINREDFAQKMKENNVGIGIHYKSIPSFTFYKKNFKWQVDDYPNAKKIGNETISIPISPKLSEKQVIKITEIVKKIFSKYA